MVVDHIGVGGVADWLGKKEEEGEAFSQDFPELFS